MVGVIKKRRNEMFLNPHSQIILWLMMKNNINSYSTHALQTVFSVFIFGIGIRPMLLLNVRTEDV